MRKTLPNRLLTALLVLAGAGCFHPASVPAPAQKAASFGAPVTLAIGQSVRYADGLEVQLEKIDDSRCPPKVVCVWEGELAPILRLRGGAIGAEQELRLGTARGTEATLASYVIALGEATTTTTTATLTVTQAAGAGDACRKTGCSSEVCSDRDQPSPCIYRPEFACYRTATCERQADGKCGWTQTPALASCLANPPDVDQ